MGKSHKLLKTTNKANLINNQFYIHVIIIEYVKHRLNNLCFHPHIKTALLVILFTLTTGIFELSAQQNPLSNIRIFKITPSIEAPIVTQNSIIPSSIQFTIKDSIVDVKYELNNNKINFPKQSLEVFRNDTILVFLRVFPINFMEPYFKIDANRARIEDIVIPIEADFNTNRNSRQNLFSKGLNYNGSFSRGITLGNTQNLVLNSQLNLQVEGDLGKGLSISAAISDDQIPIQPEGNTQILQEFDRVFIEIKKDNTSLIAGDYDLNSLPFQFANYKKKMKGMKVSNTYKIKKDTEINSKASFAISKGKFIRETIINKEGNQGPYKLNANNSSNYIIIIAGSEVIFIDGKKLTRGEQNDYTIDYNRSEITFSVKNPISSTSRIVVEYEYRDQFYLKSMYAAQSVIKRKNIEFSFDFFRESDSKSLQNNDNIDSIDYEILKLAGDDLTKAVRTNISPIQSIDDKFNEYYNKEVFEGDTILVYTPEPSEMSFLVYFSNTGEGKGDYIIDNESFANGRVYKFVGKNQGSYLPLKQIIAPAKKQMLSLGTKINLKNNLNIKTEISLSDFDNNRFSEIENDNNQGIAGLFQIDKSFHFDTTNSWKLNTQYKSEYIHKNFNSINPYRNVEYSRNWNLKDIQTKTNEASHQLSLDLQHKTDFHFRYGIQTFDRKNNYFGVNQDWNLNIDKRKFGFISSGNYLTAKGNDIQTLFFRPSIDFRYKIDSSWNLGTYFNMEQLFTEDLITNNLQSGTIGFEQNGIYLTNNLNKKIKIDLNLNRRTDKALSNNKLTNAYITDEVKLGLNWEQNKSSNLSWDLSYRKIEILDQDLTQNKNGSNLLTKIRYRFSALEKAIKSNTTYHVGVGQEPKLEYSYEKVQSGEGSHKWNDGNEDGIEQIDEFEIATFQDEADYIKIPVFNNEFISTNTLEVNQSLRFDPRSYIKKHKKYKWLKKWSSNSTFRYRQKQTINETKQLVPFFEFNLTDTTIFSHLGLIRNTIFFNKGNPKFDFQLGQSSNQNKTTLISGSELVNLRNYHINTRVNLFKSIDLITKYNKSFRNRHAENFENKNYQINADLALLTISFRPKSNFRINLTTEYDHRTNTINENTIAISKKININANYRFSEKSSSIIDFKYVNVDYNGLLNTPLQSIMLDGLNRGNNFIWSLAINQKVRKNLYLSLRYNGRKTGDIKAVHTANAQLKASF